MVLLLNKIYTGIFEVQNDRNSVVQYFSVRESISDTVGTVPGYQHFDEYLLTERDIPIRIIGGSAEIRTLGGLPLAGFQDRCLQPLGHTSEVARTINIPCCNVKSVVFDCLKKHQWCQRG